MPKQIPTFEEFHRTSIAPRNKTRAWLDAHPDVRDMALALFEDGAAIASLTKYLATYYEFPFGQSAFRHALMELSGPE